MKKTQPAPGTRRAILNPAWPEVGAKKPGYVCIVRPGPVRAGQLISLFYRGRGLINRLVSRDRDLITICGPSGKLRTLTPDLYTIEGPVIEVRPQTPVERREARAKVKLELVEQVQRVEQFLFYAERLGLDVVIEVMESLKLGVRPEEILRRMSGKTASRPKVIDLNLWRQSHPRPIKTCAVRVE